MPTYNALWLNEMGARPGGTPSTFCDPVYITSIPNSSMAMGTPPSEATVSTANRQLYLQTRKDTRELSQSIKGTIISPDDVCETCRRLKIRTAFTINSMNSSKSSAKNPKAVKAAE